MKIKIKYVKTFFNDFTGHTCHQFSVPGISDAPINIPVQVSEPKDGVIIFLNGHDIEDSNNGSYKD